MPKPTIRLADAADIPAVAALIQALDSHHDGRSSSLEATAAMVEASMATHEGTRYALAVLDGRPVGLACFAILRPGTGLGGLIFLKDLFVEHQARNQAVGAAMMAWLADYARSQGIARIDLTTGSANKGAQSFYERLGAERLDKVAYRFDLTGGGRS